MPKATKRICHREIRPFTLAAPVPFAARASASIDSSGSAALSSCGARASHRSDAVLAIICLDNAGVISAKKRKRYADRVPAAAFDVIEAAVREVQAAVQDAQGSQED